MTPIKKIGKFLPQDNNGFIINDLSLENIDDEWQAVISKIVKAYQNHLHGKLHSIYLRGSVARGTAIKGFSDIDTFALIHSNEKIRWQKADFQEPVEQKIQEEFDFVRDIEMNIASYHSDFYNQNPRLSMIIKTQSLCIFGTDLSPTLPNFKPNQNMILNLKWLETDIEDIISKIEKGTNTLEDCQFVMKVLLRAGFELVMKREGRYTQDLYLCYSTFSKYYPAYENAMRQALIWYLNPIKDRQLLIDFLHLLGCFLINQTKENAYS